MKNVCVQLHSEKNTNKIYIFSSNKVFNKGSDRPLNLRRLDHEVEYTDMNLIYNVTASTAALPTELTPYPYW